jgi:hypothetical protein
MLDHTPKKSQLLRSGEIEIHFNFSKPFQWLFTFFAAMIAYYQKVHF